MFGKGLKFWSDRQVVKVEGYEHQCRKTHQLLGCHFLRPFGGGINGSRFQ
jgi:hypothetical protein